MDLTAAKHYRPLKEVLIELIAIEENLN